MRRHLICEPAENNVGVAHQGQNFQNCQPGNDPTAGLGFDLCSEGQSSPALEGAPWVMLSALCHCSSDDDVEDDDDDGDDDDSGAGDDNGDAGSDNGDDGDEDDDGDDSDGDKDADGGHSGSDNNDDDDGDDDDYLMTEIVVVMVMVVLR